MKLLGVADLAKRWNYTKQGVHQKLKQDVSFPKPIAKINSGILVFLESDIINYEANKKTPTKNSNRFFTPTRSCCGSGRTHEDF
jgi:predicted DNA-binding transcriptional regulator AlpA